ncbi:MAG: hypothetical protein KZQ59_10720, partial [Candidatus Thiodiazotropha sp. (ex Lucinoma aequizonata)]|nr:hypothetical protein [Candidatus Thiodiazotropha sp. (ex Lucinoma aequizonata)]
MDNGVNPTRKDSQDIYVSIPFIRGDLDGIKGAYHINAVDEVSRFQCVFSVKRISERFMIPTLKEIMVTLPFSILGFHADNGSEYI